MFTDKSIILDFFKNRNKALTVVIGNQKGGVSKTANTVLIGYTLAAFGLKTLIMDLDPQANATKVMLLTKSENSDALFTVNKTMMRGVQEGSLIDLPVNIVDNLDLLPSYTDFRNFSKFIFKTTTNEYEETHIFEPLVEPLKSNYDVILVDTPPLTSEVSKNSVVFSDYVLISLQTQEDSLGGANDFINQTLVPLKKEYNLPIEIVGFLPTLVDKRGSVDKLILEAARKEFGDDMIFDTIIPQMARIKRFPIMGITDNDKFDRRVLDHYELVTNELLHRLLEFETDIEFNIDDYSKIGAENNG